MRYLCKKAFKNKMIDKIINEEIRKKINEATALKGETVNIQNVINELEEIYNNVIDRGVSMHEITVNQIGRMISALKLIKRKWQNMATW